MTFTPFTRPAMAPATGDPVIDAMAQVTAFSHAFRELDFSLRKRSDLRERAGVHDRSRTPLADPSKRLRKLAVETGYDIRHETFLHAPLEPWTGPDGALELYGKLMRADDGATWLRDYSGAELDALLWMTEERLLWITESGQVSALSDGSPRSSRSYPGATVTDKLAAIGKRLGSRARGLVLAAVHRISTGKVTRRSRRRKGELVTADGLRLSARQVCEEVNAIKAKRRDLDGYRFLSLSRCYELIRELLELELLEELVPPKHVRRERSWRTIPRVIRRVMTDPEAPPG